jgi:hypothetical protein
MYKQWNPNVLPPPPKHMFLNARIKYEMNARPETQSLRA